MPPTHQQALAAAPVVDAWRVLRERGKQAPLVVAAEEQHRGMHINRPRERRKAGSRLLFKLAPVVQRGSHFVQRDEQANASPSELC